MIQIQNFQQNLEGLAQTAAIFIKNPHNMLAVMFELQSQPPFLQIQPPRGMILQQQRKSIKIRLKNTYRQQALKMGRNPLKIIISSTQACEYNRKLLEKHGLQGWRSISKKYQQQTCFLKITLNQQLNKIRQSNKSNNSSSLKHSSRQNSFQKFRDSSIKRHKNSRLTQDLDFMFRNQQYAKQKLNRKSPIIGNRLSNSSQKNNNYPYKTATSKFYNPSKQQQNINIFQKKQQKVKQNNYIDKKVKFEQSYIVQTNNYRNVQLIILAVIAALCFSLGQNLGKLFK